MKIAYVTNYLPGYHSHAGGAEAAILATARLAERRGNEICFLTRSFDAGTVPSGGLMVSAVAVLEDYLRPFRKILEITKWYALSFDPVAYLSARRLLRTIRPDIVHCGNIQFLTFSVVAAARHLGIPVFLSVYDYWYFCPLTTLFDDGDRCCRRFHSTRCLRCLPRQYRLAQRLLLAVRKRVFDSVLSLIGTFIVLSRSSLSILSAYGIPAARITILPHIVASEAGPVTAADGAQRYVLFVGWLQKRKGLHVLLEAMRSVWAARNDIQLRVVIQDVKWEERYRRDIEDALAAIDPERVRVYKGQREKSFIRGMLQAAEVLAVPEQWENMSPIIIMEAMLCGRCIVASDIGGIPELISHGVDGFLADSTSPSDFARKILYALDNPGVARGCGLHAQQKIAAMSDPRVLSDRLVKEYAQWMKR